KPARLPIPPLARGVSQKPTSREYHGSNARRESRHPSEVSGDQPRVRFGMSGVASSMTLTIHPTPRSTVGLLDSFERGLERAVNGAFAKTFRSGIQPVEIASALRREMDTRAAVVSRERILAPNSYAVR